MTKLLSYGKLSHGKGVTKPPYPVTQYHESYRLIKLLDLELSETLAYCLQLIGAGSVYLDLSHDTYVVCVWLVVGGYVLELVLKCGSGSSYS